MLDVGCNNGITSQYLLDCGCATHVTGVELHASTVGEALRNDARFTLIEGNIVDLQIPDRYDSIIYGAVHHHILNFHGLTTAVETFKKLVGQCDGSMFFETGQIGEGGRWPWQRKMRRYFRTDEEQFFYLLRSVEHRISDFEIIGKFWIHGIRRSYLRIDVKPQETSSGSCFAADRKSWPEDKEGPLVRSFGSRKQTLGLARDSDSDDSPARFWTSSADGGIFIKQHVHHPAAASAEFAIGNQLATDWAVGPIAVTDDPEAIVFPWLQDSQPVGGFSLAPESLRRSLAVQVLEIFEEAAETPVNVESQVLLPIGSGAKLIDVVDLNPNNLLVTRVGDRDTVHVVDFEHQGCHYHYRNRIHLARILMTLRQHRTKAIANWFIGSLTGVYWLFRFQTLALDERIRRKQPSLLSVIIAEVRSVAGRLLGKVLEVFGIGA